MNAPPDTSLPPGAPDQKPWSPPARLLERAYADFAKSRLSPKDSPSAVLELLGHAGVLVAAGEAKGGQLVHSSEILERVMDDAAGILCGLLNQNISLAELHLAPTEMHLPSPAMSSMISVLNLACYSAFAMELERKCWHPNPNWPEFNRMLNVMRFVLSKKKPRTSDLGKKRSLIMPSWRPHFWWNFPKLWPGHLGRRIYA